MASLHVRGKVIWISYRNESGEWKYRSTGYRQANIVERRAAERLCAAASLRERTTATARSTNWEFVPDWLAATHSHPLTLRSYQKRWKALRIWLHDIDVGGPQQLTRENCQAYPAWRAQNGGARNTSVKELQLMSAVLQEAVRRGYIQSNVAHNLRIKRDPAAEKRPFTDEELSRIDKALRAQSHSWLMASYCLGRWQGSRLSQCAVPLDSIDLDRQVIHYPAGIMKGGRALTQPIDPHALPILRDLVAHRRSIGATSLCDLPEMPSLEWRHFLDSLEPPIHGASHHCFRVTLVTRFALAGVPESLAAKYTGHSSIAMHRIYQKYTTQDVADVLKRLA
jgi:integrase